MADVIPLRWIQNDVENAKIAFGGGRVTPPFSYLGAPIHADFELTYEALAPYVTAVLDLAAPLEGAGMSVALVEIRDGKVRVF
jgi:hypothetical protein